MDTPYAPALTVALAAIQSAARLAARVQSSHIGVVQKSDATPVTAADLAIQALLTASVHAAFPADRFVGEESSAALRADPALLETVWALLQSTALTAPAAIPSSREEMCAMLDWCAAGEPAAGVADGGRCWVFDPIDGTKSFIRGENYAINVCLLDGDGEAMSAVGAPLLSPDAAGPINNDTTGPEGSIIFGTRGGGVFVRSLKGSEARRLPRRTAAGELRGVTCIEGTNSAIPGLHARIAARVPLTYPGNDLLAWVLRWVAMARGAADATVWVYRDTGRRGKVWDHAGAMLLFREAGGKVTDIRGREIDVLAGRSMVRNSGFVAALEGAHARVLEAVQDALREEGMAAMLEE